MWSQLPRSAPEALNLSWSAPVRALLKRAAFCAGRRRFFRIFCGKSMVNPMNYRDFLWISGFNFQKTHWLRSSKTLIHVMVIECNWRNRYDTDTIISIHSRLSQSILGIPTDQPVWRDHGRLWTVLNWSFLKASVGQETKKKELVDEWKWTSPI